MKLVMCHGVFDWLHHGHLEHLEQARAMGDALMVSVLADRFSGKQRVLQPEQWRVKMLQALRCVDLAVLSDQAGPQERLRLHRPAIYARGPDYVGRRMPENDVTDELGIECRFTTSDLEMSTTRLKQAAL
jgi:cytidyltransferase-like protein